MRKRYLIASLFAAITASASIITFYNSSSISTIGNPVGNLSFYGFNVGESKSSSLLNMDKRQLAYTDYATSMQMALHGELPFSGNKCIEKADSNGISMIACQPLKSDARSIGLIYVDETLVTIVVDINPDSTDSAYKQIQSKYGPAESVWDKDKIVWWENKFKDADTAVFAPLFSPFGMIDGTSCGDCKMSEFIQNDKGSSVYLRRDNDLPTYLTLTNSDLAKKQWAVNLKKLNRQIAAEKKSSEF